MKNSKLAFFIGSFFFFIVAVLAAYHTINFPNTEMDSFQIIALLISAAVSGVFVGIGLNRME
ncbi:MAG: hypothetical protein WD552_00350 [Candidatus Paceibacterota bacterium]